MQARYILISVLALAASVCMLIEVSTWRPPVVVVELPVRLPVPKVVSISRPGGAGTASATPIWDRNGFAWYLTAKHCLPVATVGGQQVLQSFSHPKLDLALLKVKGSVGVGSKIADRTPVFGDRLVAMGYGLGVSLHMTDGRAGTKLGYMTCPIAYGCSGGAVLNEKGELVGIITQITSMSNGMFPVPVPHMSYYAPIPKSWLLDKIGV